MIFLNELQKMNEYPFIEAYSCIAQMPENQTFEELVLEVSMYDPPLADNLAKITRDIEDEKAFREFVKTKINSLMQLL